MGNFSRLLGQYSASSDAENESNDSIDCQEDNLVARVQCTQLSQTRCNYTVSQENDTDVAHYNFNAHQPILVIFDRGVAKRVCNQTVICYLLNT